MSTVAGMEFRISDTFTDSLARLAGEEQKAAKTAAFDLQLNPAQPGLQFHKLERAKDPRFWSVRVNRDVRLIVHRSENSLLLCYVAHHDEAYHWAERRKLETHPKTGAAQLVELRETVQEISIPSFVASKLTPLPFAHIPDSELSSYGVPPEWIIEVKAADEDTILTIAAHLPAEAAEAVLDMAIGAKPKTPVKLPPGADPFTHPDALRRFRVMGNVEELARAMDYPWEKWTVFLHPEQGQLVKRDYKGPARVSGSAGTGKTIVALHRAAFLARKHSDSRILLITLSDSLSNALATKLRRLIGTEPRLGERIEVYALDALGKRLYHLAFGTVRIASQENIRAILTEAAASSNEDAKFSPHFLESEWKQVVDAWQIESWEGYRDVVRLGRKTRLPEKQRLLLWSTFEGVRSALKSRGLVTYAELFTCLASQLSGGAAAPFDFAVVDEAQDVSIAQLRFLAALGANRPNSLFFAGDLGQRIFQQPFSWKALGVDVRGRSSTLKVNYRTSHQIRMQADRLLGPEVTDVDGNREDRRGTISVFNGPAPEIRACDTERSERQVASEWIASKLKDGVKPHEIGVFVRSAAQMPRARVAVEDAGCTCQMLDEHVETVTNRISIGTMHLAKGLEFRAVAVMACDDEVIPLQERIETVTDDADLEEVYNTERHLLYVACTRARDYLLVTSVKPSSEFLDDLKT